MSEVKEVKEAVIAALKLGTLLYSTFKDGVQLSDFNALVSAYNNDADFKAALDTGLADAKAIPGELQALDFSGGIELVTALLPEIQKTIEALKAPVVAQA